MNENKIKFGRSLADTLYFVWEKLLHFATAKDDVYRNLYDHIFSERIAGLIYENFPDFHYVDPDTSYFDDITAFITSFQDYIENKEKEEVI